MEDEKRETTTRPAEEEGTLHIPSARGRTRANFAARMGEAGYVTGRRYDAVKNAFLSYKPSHGKIRPLRPRITSGGETFGAGKKIYAKLCLVGGYLRLFMALDPKAYNRQKYHHKDCTEIARYAKIPFMIKLSSDRQVRYAVELIDELMRAGGYEPDEAYEPKDQANIFKPSRNRRVIYLDRGAAMGGDAEAAEEEAFSAPAEGAAADAAEPDEGDEPEAGEPSAIDVRLPVHARVVDREGGRRGKIRGSVWYNEEDAEIGEFRKEETNVFLYCGGERTAYVDKNYNILSLADKYIATILKFRWLPVLIIVFLLALITVLSVLLSAYFMSRSSDYAPVIFVADEHGTSWEDIENLPVFKNEAFGDTVIAPGLTGSYRFTFENQNADALTFSLAFSERNEYGIGLVYRLKRDNTYITGGEYVPVDELGVSDMTIEAHSSTMFEIEWFWEHNDAADTVAGEHEALYTLIIDFTASVLGE